ncbi:hypothetical protein X798_04366 [Onchocerca flexuosa]|uniref:Uncharacterized protein n=1 Tax=Onchocerca flexuosa TaxID=387005 RepID=A0A238BTC8_9BILA|nr:hypothetical protein X798_04366 [Onchocerca flexuosa]
MNSLRSSDFNMLSSYADDSHVSFRKRSSKIMEASAWATSIEIWMKKIAHHTMFIS